MARRKGIEEIEWHTTDVLTKAIATTLPKWEEWWLYALREVVRLQLGYVASMARPPDEEVEEARRTLAGWCEGAPMLDIRYVLRLINQEIRRRGKGLTGASGDHA